MKDAPTVWLVARASGMIAYALLGASVLGGLILKSRPFGKRLKGATAMEIHRTVSTAAIVAVAVHGVALLLDRAVELRFGDLLIPGTAPYRPVWTGAGVIAAELMVLVAVSFPLRKPIGMKLWRRLHWATYPVFALASAHGIMAGSDTGRPWADAVYVGMITAVAAAVTFRILTRAPKRAPRPQAAAETTARMRAVTTDR